jgi:hypothetical protein
MELGAVRLLFGFLVVVFGSVSVVANAQAQSRMTLDAQQHEVERKSTLLASNLLTKWMSANGRQLRGIGILWSCKEVELADAVLNALPDKRFEKLVNNAVEAGEFKDLPDYHPFYVRQKIFMYFLGFQEGVQAGAYLLASKEQCTATIARGKSYLNTR